MFLSPCFLLPLLPVYLAEWKPVKRLKLFSKGFGSTLGSIGIVIGLGVMMGRILEVSGAAEKIAYSFIKWLGEKREEWALAITGYVVSIPIFVDSAFIILYPVAKALAKKGNRFSVNFRSCSGWGAGRYASYCTTHTRTSGSSRIIWS